MDRFVSVTWLGALALAVSLASPATALSIDVTASSSDWNEVIYPGITPDFSDDQQTGHTEADIVGNATGDPAFMIWFDDLGTASPTDGYMGFRVRLGADQNPAGFGHFFGVGFDVADSLGVLDGAIDLFVGVDFSGNPDQLGIFDPGTGSNTSPSTTSIVSTPLVSYTPGSVPGDPTYDNYDFSGVSSIDGGAVNSDLDLDGNEDFFLSFVIPFADIVAQLQVIFPDFDEDTLIQMVIGTSTQPNALNQDLGGPDGGTRSTQTWSALGAISEPVSALALVPEPGTGLLLALGLVGIALGRRRERR